MSSNFKQNKGEGKGKSIDVSTPSNNTSDIKAKANTNPYGKNQGKKGSRTDSKAINDSQWYVPNAQLARDAANIPYNTYVGPLYQLVRNEASSSNTRGGIPGIYVYKYIPCINETGPMSGINMAMRALYTYVRHANAGHANYEAPDLMMYILAVDSIYLQIHELTRIIKLATSYSLGNRLLPKKILQTMGIDWSRLSQNLANYRARLNQLIARTNTLAVPRDFDLFRRRAVLGNNILTDEPNKPTQLIIPVSDIYYEFDPTAPTGSSLVGKSTRVNEEGTIFNKDRSPEAGVPCYYYPCSYDIDKFFDNVETCINVLLADEDINIMSGDILKAYGASNLFMLEYIGENDTITFSHDEALLQQFANSTVVDLFGATIDNGINTSDKSPLQFSDTRHSSTTATQALPVISQNKGTIVFHAFINTRHGKPNDGLFSVAGRPFCSLGHAPIRTDKSEISEAETLEITRLTMLSKFLQVHDLEDFEYEGYGIVHGTEIGLGWIVYTPEVDGASQDIYTLSFNMQWMQFAGTSNDIYFDDLGRLTKGIVTLVPDKNVQALNDMQHCPFLNNPIIHNAVIGLSFGPLPYVLGKGKYTDTSGIKGVKLTYSISKASERVALVDNVTLGTMHDVAMLGLLKLTYYNK